MMKPKIVKWIIGMLVAAVLLVGLLVVIVLTPSLLYATKTSVGTFIVYHNQPFDKELKLRLDDATEIIKTSECYDGNIHFDICLKDGSLYPSLLQVFLGRAFALGFTSNKVVLCGNTNIKENYLELDGSKFNLTQLLAHEETHCLVFHKVGFWRSNPVANHPYWKWEGYPEYISRRAADQTDLVKNIEQLNEAIRKDKDEWGIRFADSTVSSRKYFQYRLLIQYCLDVKKMTYENVLKDSTSEQTITTQMMNWFAIQKN
jgi:hypothetical protein